MEEPCILEPQSNNFKVYIRIRPPLSRELESKKYIPTVKVSQDKKQILLYEYHGYEYMKPEALMDLESNANNYYLHQFSFDYVYDESSGQQIVYENSAKSAVLSILQGFNSTIMAYGQTGTGKTFTMEGTFTENSQGILPRSIDEIFRYIENNQKNNSFIVKISYLQIYNETIQDLLTYDKANLMIREDRKKGVFVEGLSEWIVQSSEEVLNLIKKGGLMRTTGTTKMNDLSSRSHAIFTVIVEKTTEICRNSQIVIGKLNFVDLAGSERIRMTGATGKRLEETKKINQSLSALGNVISALTDNKANKSHIPYRDSKITRILEDSLGGNCKTVLITMISPLIDSFFESLCSLKFANRAKNIKNTPVINEGIAVKVIDNQRITDNNNINLQKKEIISNDETNILINKEEVIEYKNQIEQYKELIMKQKNVMISMSERLKEKEENIHRMQEELEVFDKIHRDFKEALNKENVRVKFLEKLLRGNNIDFQYEDEQNCFKTEKAENERKFSFKNLQENKLNITFNHDKENNRNIQQSLVQIIEIKKLVDNVIYDLSTPNDPCQLQNVANDILKLQKLVDKLLESEQKGRKINHNFSPLNNLTNLLDPNGCIKSRKPIHSISPLNINRKDINSELTSKLNNTMKLGKDNFKSKENIFNVIPLRGEINIYEIMNS